VPESLIEDHVLEWFRDKYVKKGEDGDSKGVAVYGQKLPHVVRAVEAVCRAHFKTEPVWLRRETTEEVKDLEGVIAFEDVCVDTKASAKAGSWVVFPRDERFFGSLVIPCKFDSEAKCPRWNTALEEWGDGDPAWGKLLKREFGYGLVPFRGWAKWFLHYGTSRGGKSLIEVVRKALVGNRHYLGKSMVAMTQRFGLHKLSYARVLCINEIRELDKWNTEQATALWKSIIGGDPQDFDVKHREGMENVVSPSMLVMLSNKVPTINDENRGMSSKMVLVPFYVSFEGKEDENLDKKLIAELPGIARWACEGAVELWQAKSNPERWPVLESAKGDVGEFLGQNNEADEFLEWAFRKEPSGYVDYQLIWAFYKEWAKDSKLKVWKSERAVNRWIEENNSWGVRRGRKFSKPRGFYGLGLKRVIEENEGGTSGMEEGHTEE
jgi:phage/plasmid-associated DNA primase